MSFSTIYDRELEVNVRISKSSSEEGRRKRLERWPREAGLSTPLDDSGMGFLQLVKSFAADYGLEPGERSWSTEEIAGKIIVRMEWKLNRGNEVKGFARMLSEINTVPVGDEKDSLIYTVRVRYTIELDNDVLAERATSSDVPEVSIL